MNTLTPHLMSRLWNNRFCRRAFRVTAYGAIGLAAIYAIPSDEIGTKVQEIVRARPAGESRESGGLSINGIPVDYLNNDNIYSRDSFEDRSGAYVIRFTKTPSHNIDEVVASVLAFENPHNLGFSFTGNEPQETQELVVSPEVTLTSIVVRKANSKYEVTFR